jgi:uncharacterized protein YbjT (DUF2867 family)
VTGAPGFIGSHLWARLVAEGHDVVEFEDLSYGELENPADVPEVRFVEDDLRNEGAVRKAVSGCEVILLHDPHVVAARPELGGQLQNVAGHSPHVQAGDDLDYPHRAGFSAFSPDPLNGIREEITVLIGPPRPLRLPSSSA